MYKYEACSPSGSLVARIAHRIALLAALTASVVMVDTTTLHAQEAPSSPYVTPPPGGYAYPPPQGSGYPPPQGSAYPPPQGSAYPPPQGSGYPPPQAYGPQAYRVQMLLSERQKWERPASLAAPITLLAVGGGLLLTGFGVIFPLAAESCDDYYDDYCDEEDWNGGMVAGALLGTGGLVLTIVGASILPSRIIRRKRRGRELNRIDAELRSLGVQASLAPMLGRERAGMQATFRF